MRKVVFSVAAIMCFVAASAQTPTLFTIGDSTMAENSRYLDDPGDEGRGWVQGLTQFVTGDLIIRNFAVSGRSSKSFIGEGKWDRVLSLMKSGDYLLIQFGHNDPKRDTLRYADPETAFKDNFRKFVSEARAKGVTPILATSIVRRRWAADKTSLIDTHGRYVEAVIEVAQELNVPLVDMKALTEQMVLDAGVEGSTKYFLYLEPEASERYPDGVKDDTHLCERGAVAFSKAFAEECVKQNNPLAKFFNN